eukprot:jgi/Bigna1/71221/fgenesh1_pg.15_\
MRGYPATAGTILSSGGGGVFVGVFTSTIQLVICPVAEAYVGSLDLLLLSEIYWIRTGLGAVLGVTMVWASMRGHASMVEIEEEEEEGGGGGVPLGDGSGGEYLLMSAALVSAGVCSASVLCPRVEGENKAARRGMLVNLKYMERDAWVLNASYLAGGLSGGIGGYFRAKGTAYVPAWFLVVCGESSWGCTLGMLSAFIVPFVVAYARNLHFKMISE